MIENDRHEAMNAMLNRRSIRRYQPEPVPRVMVEQLLNAGIWAPSAHNRQPWRFAVIESDEQKVLLARAMGARLRRDLENDDVPINVIEADVNRSYDRITSAPLLIMVCLSMDDMDVYSDDKRNTNEYIMAVQSVAMAGQNILLSAHALGLGACWMCAPLFCSDVVVSTLELPQSWQAQGLITVGFPAQKREKTRIPIEERVLWR